MPRASDLSHGDPVEEPTGFSCVRLLSGDAARITVAGELDSGTVPRLDDALRSAEADGARVVLDVSRLESMDASGAQLLLQADRRMRRAGGRLILAHAGATLDWFFELMDIEDALEVMDCPLADGGYPPKGATGASARSFRVPDQALAPLASGFVSTTDECAELRARVCELEQELLDLVFQPPGDLAAVRTLPSPM